MRTPKPAVARPEQVRYTPHALGGDSDMRAVALLAFLFALAACGCEAMKNDRILGDKPWQPTSLGGMTER
jgi:hypothetical protein